MLDILLELSSGRKGMRERTATFASFRTQGSHHGRERVAQLTRDVGVRRPPLRIGQIYRTPASQVIIFTPLSDYFNLTKWPCFPLEWSLRDEM